MKTVRLDPIMETQAVHTEDRVLDALLAQDLNVLMACGGKGRCATCHVRVTSNQHCVTPKTEREKRALARIRGADHRSRLACQCRVIGDDVVVEIPEGMFIEQATDLIEFLGKRAESDVLHPITGEILVMRGRIITRSRIEELKQLDFEGSDL